MRRRFVVAVLVFYAVLVAVLVLGPQVLAKRTTTAVTSCTGALAHATTNDMTVPPGAVCRLTASTVNGDVTVQSDAYFEASGTAVYGDVHADGPLTVFLHDGTSVTGSVVVDGAQQVFLYKTTVRGSVKVTRAMAPGFGHVQVCQSTAGRIEVKGSGPDVLVGDPAGGCPGNEVAGNVVVADNQAMSELEVSGNVIAGSLYVTGNFGTSPKRVANNAVQGTVDLTGNAVPFQASNN